MLMPSIFGENLFDDWFDGFPFDAMDKEMSNTEKKLYGKKAGRIMKTDIREKDNGYELVVDLPGFTKDEIKASVENGYLTISAAKGLDKDEKEKDLMRKSSKLNDIAMEKIIPWVAKGLTEKELNAKMREIYKEIGCEDVSFDPITAYGHGAADPHHVTDDSKGKRGDCVILDIGGFKDNYASDMTRTVFIGEVSDRAKEIYDIVVEANRRGIEAAKPGNRMCDVDLAARNYIEEKGFGEYFTHRTGHSIGLEDHEFGDVSSVNTDIIKVGQCFSVEPGIYLPDENIGVRIEDLVIITEDGCEVLNDFTKDLIVVPEE